MEKIDLYAQILKELYTTRQSNMLIDALGHAVDSTYDDKKNIHDVLRSVLPFDQSDTLVEIAKETQVDLDDNSQAQTFISDLIAILKELPTVDLTLAYSPTYEQLRSFSKWWRRNSQPFILLNITVNKELIAGAMIGYDGIMQDYSLHKVLGTYIEEKSEK